MIDEFMTAATDLFGTNCKWSRPSPAPKLHPVLPCDSPHYPCCFLCGVGVEPGRRAGALMRGAGGGGRVPPNIAFGAAYVWCKGGARVAGWRFAEGRWSLQRPSPRTASDPRRGANVCCRCLACGVWRCPAASRYSSSSSSCTGRLACRQACCSLRTLTRTTPSRSSRRTARSSSATTTTSRARPVETEGVHKAAWGYPPWFRWLTGDAY